MAETKTKIPFPIAIGLVGAPGSGKAQLGQMFFEIANEYFTENDSDLWVIENAGRIIEQDFDYAMGVYGSYVDDMRAYHIRQEMEHAALAKGVSYITLGTPVDHIAHTGINLETLMTGLQTPDLEAKVQRWQVTMTMMTFLMQSHFRYTFGFYLPHPGTSVILPGEADTESEYNQRIDKAIQMVMANFGMRIQVLNEGTLEDKAQTMFDTVKRIMENGPELPEGEEPTPEEDSMGDHVDAPDILGLSDDEIEADSAEAAEYEKRIAMFEDAAVMDPMPDEKED